jgi:hypothetical protein
MIKRIFIGIVVIAIHLIFFLRPVSKNYKDGYFIIVNNQIYLKLKSERQLMTHDPVSIFTRKTYQDSILIPIPFTSDGIISGDKIYVGKGNYKYKGDIKIKGATVNVNYLLIILTTKNLNH